MSELRFKIGKFIILLGGVTLLLFVFSVIANSGNFYLIITGIILVLFGTILRKKKKDKEVESTNPDLKMNHRGKYQNSRFNTHEEHEERQSRRSRRS
jgi:flagellar biosynthesis component FlhA